MLDINEALELDYYLVLTGPRATARDAGMIGAWQIDAVYLCDSKHLLTEQRRRDVKIGTASGVREVNGRRPRSIPALPARLSSSTMTSGGSWRYSVAEALSSPRQTQRTPPCDECRTAASGAGRETDHSVENRT
jgi:hypothetical protein